ncbi:DEAD/DEAH box helicase [Nocardiopsis sp. NRRL B-16309]|uniref:DEAD/DEAH box helicase n=1 Tax=Nocardiopsis sp. NRRL B-16309 TaxID=1519494 RepID=UPI0006AF9C66|nr:DNA helicase [Nocardiopsis sp. NRRL B-16309]
MRSLRDDEHETGGPGPGGTVVGAVGIRPVTQVARSGVGQASLRWKPPIDRSEVRSLLSYLRACLSREAVHTHGVRAEHVDSDTCACLPTGPELLFSGARETLPLHPESARVLRLSLRRGQALRYGYPLVVVGEGADRAALPLLTVDVRVVDDLEAATGAYDPTGAQGPLVRPVGPPDVNCALLERLGITDPEDLFELRTRLRTGAPDTARRPAAVAELAAKVRTLLSRLEIERVDDIDPLGTRGLPRVMDPGAHNVAVVFRAGPGGQFDTDDPEPGGVEGILADLDPADRDGLNPDEVAGTALASLLGGGARDTGAAGGDGDTPPISATALTQSQYEVVRSAMRDRLTVAAAPPGSGLTDLLDALVRTAVGHGLRVLVCAAAEDDVRDVLRAAESAPAHPVVRIGGPGQRAAEIRLLDRILAEHAGPPAEGARTPPGAEDAARHWRELSEAWNRVQEVWRTMDTLASGGHALARLAVERVHSISQGWDPDRLFTPEHGGPEYWLHRAERARSGGLTGLQHRTAIRRELGVPTDPDSLVRLCAVARMESEWREAVDRRTGCPPLGRLTAELADAGERHQRAGAACLRAVTEPRLRRGRAAVENRLETLNWHHGSGWPGLPALLDTLPAWVCRTDQARALPPTAGLFDLVIVAGAERTRVAELLPVLYRATRAVVIGDPAHPGPTSTLEPDEERRALAAAGTTADQLEARGLRHGSGSALRAAYKAAPPLLWLDEHHGASPELAEIASQRCYGGRVAVRTAPDMTGRGVVDWRDVAGTCEAAPGASYINRDEAYRVLVVVDELDAEVPPGTTMAVVAPTQPQVALIRRLLAKRVLRHDVRVGGADLLGRDGDTVDLTVLSPMLAKGSPAIAERRVRRMSHLWSTVFTRTRRLVVVGDRTYWSGEDGPLGDLLASAADTGAIGSDPARATLVDRLRGAGTSVLTRQTIQGWTVDLVVHFGARRLLLLLDRESHGRGLRHLVARGEALNRTTGDPVVVVPAWRCLADPETLVREILSAR